MVQIYGRCFGNSSAYWVGDNTKYRKPTPPPLPEWCFRTAQNGGREKDPRFRNDPQCQTVEYPNQFDHNTQFCKAGDHKFCAGKDINMFCSQKTDFDPRE